MEACLPLSHKKYQGNKSFDTPARLGVYCRRRSGKSVAHMLSRVVGSIVGNHEAVCSLKSECTFVIKEAYDGVAVKR